MTNLEEVTILRPVFGYRSWKIHDTCVTTHRGIEHRLCLRSVVVPQRWNFRQELVAHCIPGKTHCPSDCGENTPQEQGKCGIHASQSFDETIHVRMSAIFLKGRVMGRVKLWGDMFLGSKNWFRAQFAYPDSLEWTTCGFCEKLYRPQDTYLTIRTRTAFPRAFDDSFWDIVCKDCFKKKKFLHSSDPRVLREPGWHRELVESYGLTNAA